MEKDDHVEIPSCSSKESDGNQSEEASAITRRKIRTKKEDKICHVCGDKALGFNFNAMTCESCKAFFRRNALKPSTIKCMFSGNCMIDIRTRRFCPPCRLERCLTTGMRKEMILDESERKARMKKVMANRQKRKQSDDIGDSKLFDSVEVKEEPLSDAEVMPDQSGYTMYEGRCLSDMLSTSSKSLESDESVLDLSFAQDCEKPMGQGWFRNLTMEELDIFNNLKLNYSATVAEPKVDKNLSESDYSKAEDLVNHSELAVRRLIKFIKKIEDFQMLCQEDQISALKGCVMNSLLLRSVWFYDVEQDAWITPKGSIPTNILKKTTGYGDLHDAHTKYCRSLKLLAKNDHIIFALLQIIVIFNPDGTALLNKTVIADLQEKYILLLRHYLEAEFSYNLSGQYFSHLMLKLSELKALSESHGRVLLQVNPLQIEPLMLEILNLH